MRKQNWMMIVGALALVILVVGILLWRSGRNADANGGSRKPAVETLEKEKPVVAQQSNGVEVQKETEQPEEIKKPAEAENLPSLEELMAAGDWKPVEESEEAKPTEAPASDEKTTPTEKPATTQKPTVTQKPESMAGEVSPPTGTPHPLATEAPSPVEVTPVKASAEPSPLPTGAPTTENTLEHTHIFEKVYWYGEPSCGTAHNYYNLICRECGANGGDGEDAVEHTPVSTCTECKEGCKKYQVLEATCTACGADLGKEITLLGEEHQWITAMGDPVWDEEQQDFVRKEIAYCQHCFMEK